MSKEIIVKKFLPIQTRFVKLRSDRRLPNHTPHPAFGHPLPKGEGLGVRGIVTRLYTFVLGGAAVRGHDSSLSAFLSPLALGERISGGRGADSAPRHVLLLLRLLILAALTGTLISILIAPARSMCSPKAPALRISAWYWLNSIEKEKWDQEFKTAAEAGFTDLVLCWGLNAAAVAEQKENTRMALDLCQKHGLKAYLLVWHPTHNSLPRRSEFQQVDNRGNLLFAFNLFHRQWRSTQWKDYLQKVVKAYKDHPALAGYLFDDTFGLGPVGTFEGDKSKVAGDFVSYSSYDIEQFRKWLRQKYREISQLQKAWGQSVIDWESVEPPRKPTRENEAAWEDWCEARLQWLKDWAVDTMKFMRAVDPSPEHEIYLEDAQYVLGLEPRPSADSYRSVTVKDTLGLDFPLVARYFDAVCGYTYFKWGAPDSLDKALETTRLTLQTTQSRVGKDKKIIYTFWVSDADINRPLPLVYPNAEQIVAIDKAALDLGIRHIDYYAFRVGDFRVSEAEWPKRRPGSRTNYPITEPLSGRYLCDRPDVLRELADKHRALKAR